jgi:hypothetical protein
VFTAKSPNTDSLTMSKSYDPKEIAAWKAQIYGDNGNDGRVDDWASTDQAVSSPRKSVQAKLGSSINKGNDSYSSSHGEWLGSPTAAKRSYKVKGEIKKPEL